MKELKASSVTMPWLIMVVQAPASRVDGLDKDLPLASTINGVDGTTRAMLCLHVWLCMASETLFVYPFFCVVCSPLTPKGMINLKCGWVATVSNFSATLFTRWPMPVLCWSLTIKGMATACDVNVVWVNAGSF